MEVKEERIPFLHSTKFIFNISQNHQRKYPTILPVVYLNML